MGTAGRNLHRSLEKCSETLLADKADGLVELERQQMAALGLLVTCARSEEALPVER